jgi:hypothetical protein
MINFSSDKNFILNFFKKIRRLKVKLYKRRKIKESKTNFHRNYHITFNIVINDEFNPQKIEKKFSMIVPGKAAYFAKRNLKECMIEKIDFNFIEIEELTDEQYDSFIESMENELNKGVED